MFFKHKLLALIFNILTLFSPLNRFRVCFVTDEDDSFNISYENIISEFKKHNPEYHVSFFIKNKFSIRGLYYLATSKYIFLDDNFFPFAFMHFKKEAFITQLWHAPGVFKRFGYQTISDENTKSLLRNIGEKINLLTVTSKNIKNFYSVAFQINMDNIKALGYPKLDYYTSEKLENNTFRDDFYRKFPQAKDKKIILYAPTFRENPENNNMFQYLDMEKLQKTIKSEYVFLVRLHPKIKKFIKNNLSLETLNNVDIIDVTDYPQEQELLLISDILITDYSSIMLEAVYIDKPVIFFPYDLDDYLAYERGFYFDYTSTVPGPIARNTDELINILTDINSNLKDTTSFMDFEFDYKDSYSSKRIVDYILKKN